MQNDLVALLKPADLDTLSSHCRSVDIVRGTTVKYEKNAGDILFPASGFFSILVQTGSQETEIGLVGREGLIGAPTVLGLDIGGYRAIARHDGRAIGISLETLRRLVAGHPGIAAIILRYVRGIVSQLVHTSVAHARLKLPQKVSYWLLMASDRTDGAPLQVSHEVLATALGCGRARISGALRELEGEGAIETGSRSIKVLDRSRLVLHTAGIYPGPQADEERPPERVPADA